MGEKSDLGIYERKLRFSFLGVEKINADTYSLERLWLQAEYQSAGWAEKICTVV